jgi:hypothetical protein
MRLRVLDETECYLRCYGEHDDSVQIVRIEPHRPRFESTLSGEDIRRLFELRLDAREPVPEDEFEVEAEAA